jgi:hypothetical protein
VASTGTLVWASESEEKGKAKNKATYGAGSIKLMEVNFPRGTPQIPSSCFCRLGAGAVDQMSYLLRKNNKCKNSIRRGRVDLNMFLTTEKCFPHHMRKFV